MRLILHTNSKFEQTYTMCHICLIVILPSDSIKANDKNNHINEWYNRVIDKHKHTLLDFMQS